MSTQVAVCIVLLFLFLLTQAWFAGACLSAGIRTEALPGRHGPVFRRSFDAGGAPVASAEILLLSSILWAIVDDHTRTLVWMAAAAAGIGLCAGVVYSGRWTRGPASASRACGKGLLAVSIAVVCATECSGYPVPLGWAPCAGVIGVAAYVGAVIVAWGLLLAHPRATEIGPQDSFSARQGDGLGCDGLRSYSDPELDLVHLVAFASFIVGAGLSAAIFTSIGGSSVWLILPAGEASFGVWAIQLALLSRFTHSRGAQRLRVRRILTCLGSTGGGLALLLAIGQAAVGIRTLESPASLYIALAAGGVGCLACEAEVFIELMSRTSKSGFS